ncbi:hypothetical protein PM082_003473 [Marasmius tenuissimus]|nr:hypothetical protein PM082_003473 [Marasmius tenuissimus]
MWCCRSLESGAWAIDPEEGTLRAPKDDRKFLENFQPPYTTTAMDSCGVSEMRRHSRERVLATTNSPFRLDISLPSSYFLSPSCPRRDEGRFVVLPAHKSTSLAAIYSL